MKYTQAQCKERFNNLASIFLEGITAIDQDTPATYPGNDPGNPPQWWSDMMDIRRYVKDKTK